MLNSLAAFAIVGLVNDIFKITGSDVRPHRRRRQRRAAGPVRPRRQPRRSSSPWHACPIAYVADLPDDARLRDPDRRRQPERRPLRGHEPAAADRPDDEPVRAVRRPRRGDRDPRASATTRRSSGRRSASPGSPSRCSAGPTRSGSCSPRCCSAGCAPARRRCRSRPTIPIEIIDVIQGLILLFLAAEIVIRRVFRIRAETGHAG